MRDGQNTSAANSERQLHLKMDSEDLVHFAGHVTNRIWKEVVDHIPAKDKTPDLYLAVRGAVERELREHVVAMDLCGLGVICQAAQEYNPWPDADEIPSGLTLHK